MMNMAQLTRSKIAYDLSISPHRLTVTYGENPLTFVFSSALYKTKFLEKMGDHREQISESLSKRFGVKVNQPLVADFRLYTTIEKRGFLLIQDGVECKWPDKVVLDGERVILQS